MPILETKKLRKLLKAKQPVIESKESNPFFTEEENKDEEYNERNNYENFNEKINANIDLNDRYATYSFIEAYLSFESSDL